MRPRLGPKSLLLLRHLADVGPLTPREGGAILMPDAKGTGQTRGGGQGKTDARGTANRAAGCLLGYLARAGWVVAGRGERYHVPYSITATGRAELEAAARAIEADPVIAAWDPVPEGRKRCRKCSRARPVDLFFKDASSRDGLERCCRFCHNERQAEHRAARLADRDADTQWQRASKEVLVQRCVALIRAVREARRVGCWRGQAGIRAYSALGDALDLFTGNGSKDPELVAADVLEPDDNHPPRHADPADTEYGPQHRTPAKYRGRLVDRREATP